jgi:hypothetical protein
MKNQDFWRFPKVLPSYSPPPLWGEDQGEGVNKKRFSQ